MLKVITSNVLSPNYQVDICERPGETLSRSMLAARYFISESADFIMIQESSKIFSDVMDVYKEEMGMTYIEQPIGPPSNPGKNRLGILHNTAKWDVFFNYTPMCISLHQSLYPEALQSRLFRGQLVMFVSKAVPNYYLLIGNIHGSGTETVITREVLSIMFRVIRNSIDVTIPVVIGGDMNAIRVPHGFDIINSAFPTAQHNFLLTEHGISFKGSLTSPDCFVVRGLTPSRMSSWPDMTSEYYPYRYDPACLSGANMPLAMLDLCRVSEGATVIADVFNPNNISQECNRRTVKHVRQASLHGWYSDHAAFTVNFRI